MKLNKLFMLAMAGLAMTACSNDDEMGNNLAGNGVVEVRIVSPQTRSLVEATPGNNGDKVTVQGTITVKLTAATGSAEKTITANGGSQTVKFYDVSGPQKIEAYINGGDTKAQGTTDVKDMQILPKSIPAYGSSTTFNLTGKTEMNSGKKYEMYAAKVTMEIPVARLEVSGIKHVTHPVEGEDVCKFSALTIDGIYLDKVASTLNGTIVDYSMPEIKGGQDGTTVLTPAPILWDAITSPNNFLLENSVWPATEATAKAFAYNFYPQTGQQPILKIYFAKATATDETNPVSQPRYAVIKSYNQDENFKFEAGKIYRITDVTLKDKNIIGDEEGNTLYGVDVTVVEAQWTIADITGQWEEQ